MSDGSDEQPNRPMVAMIGLDAADADFIEQNATLLPNIARLMAGQTLHRLKIEPLSGAVWPTFMSENTPDVHGIYHHIQWDPLKMRMRRTHPDWIGESEPFWRQLARAGTKVLSFDVPFLFKGDSGGAIEIANWGSHDLVDRFWCSHPEVENRILSFASGHPMGFEIPVDKTPKDLDQIFERIVSGISLKTDVVCELMDEFANDLLIVAYGEAHRAGHILWPEIGINDSRVPAAALLDVYAHLDSAIGRIVKRAGPDCAIILFSLHGMGPNQSQSHLSSEMLKVALSQIPEGTGSSGETFGLMRMLRRSVPAGLQMAIAKIVPKSVRDFVVAHEVSGGFRWSQTSIISLDGDLCGYWRANIKGREAKGILPSDSPFLDDIAAELKKFTTRDGRPIVQKVHFPARDWTGNRAHLLPDIVAEWDPSLLAIDAALHPTGGEIFGHRSTGRTGNHRFEGFCSVHAPSGPKHAGVLPGHVKELGALVRTLLESQRR